MTEFEGKTLALVLWSEADGEDEASVHKGILHKTGEGYEFRQGNDGPKLSLTPDWLARITTVPEDLKETLLNADYCLSLTVGPIPDGTDESELIFTGLRTPPAGD